MKLLAICVSLMLPAQTLWAQAGATRYRRRTDRSAEKKPAKEKKEKRRKEKTSEKEKAAEKPSEPGNRDSFTFTDDLKAVAFSAKGRFAAARGPDGGPDRIKIWDTQERKMHLVLDAGWSGTTETLAFSPDGDTIASGEGSEVSLWDLETGQRWRRFEDEAPSSGPIAFDPTTKFFSAVMGKRVLVWPLEQKRRQEENLLLSWPEGSQIRDLAFSPDGKKLAAIGFRSPRQTHGQIEILDPVAGGVIKTLQDADVGFFCGGFSRNGRVVFGAGVRPTPDGPRAELVFWSVKTWKTILRIPTGIEGEVLEAAFSPDGLSMAAVIGGHSGMPVFDLRNGKRIRTMPGVEVERSGGVSVSADGNLVMAGGHKTVKFWTAAQVFDTGRAAPARTKRSKPRVRRRRPPPRETAVVDPVGAEPAAGAPLGAPLGAGGEDEGPVDAGETQDNP
jgi:WD40 repeat protein